VKVVVIIVTYNGAGWIEKCLNSLRNSSLNTDVIVIDNASTDETVSLIENLYPEVELVKRANNLGFGQANNIGLRMALDQNADFVFLLNQDAWIDQDTIGN
jgi:N-acetylglucosaminyl-diphospho-decaprenol L-rhamnosyltransferase